MAVEEVCDVVDLGAYCNVAGLLVVVGRHIGGRNSRKAAAWHCGGGRHAFDVFRLRSFAITDVSTVVDRLDLRGESMLWDGCCDNKWAGAKFLLG